ncbi:MFS transporter [Enhygromyxa salina]|uniref:Major Facilitator Superfamily protein n=1 Tax=Enhygromyxa salina TaxID=215803 RepID=A0A2S9YNX1_9BACT|nr:MFS transporter [Enhygromyxa salina]PRQ06793.1 Major Facilitator Superfamily protein [Enhygromyxa salina]
MTAAEQVSAKRALVVISIGVLLASSTWLSGTAAARELARVWALSPSEAARLTSATQWGFIAGTLVYAATNLADRFDARRVFCGSAVLGACFNLGFAWLSDGLWSALVLRFATGMTLAGVYPVGMKLIAGWYREGLGWRLGVMVGCLTLGTAFPFGVAALGLALDWRALASIASIASVVGGLLVRLGCDEGPLLRTRARLDLRVVGRVFRHRPFRDAAFGYFGHMWELYALWSLTAVWLDARFAAANAGAWAERVSLLAFATVGVGALGCVAGGLLSRRLGERKVALIALTGSGVACLISGFAFELPPGWLTVFLLAWGVLVVADSPQFSALAARHAPSEYTGTALTIQNGLGFAISTVSIQLVPRLAELVGWRWVFAVLAIGPMVGVYFTARGRDDATAA